MHIYTRAKSSKLTTAMKKSWCKEVWESSEEAGSLDKQTLGKAFLEWDVRPSIWTAGWETGDGQGRQSGVVFRMVEGQITERSVSQDWDLKMLSINEMAKEKRGQSLGKHSAWSFFKWLCWQREWRDFLQEWWRWCNVCPRQPDGSGGRVDWRWVSGKYPVPKAGVFQIIDA